MSARDRDPMDWKENARLVFSDCLSLAYLLEICINKRCNRYDIILSESRLDVQTRPKNGGNNNK